MLKLNKSDIIRIINDEMRQKNVDAECYRLAVRNGRGDRNLIFKEYYKMRSAALLAESNLVSEVAVEKEDYISTTQCARYVSSRNNVRETQPRRKLMEKANFFELVIANLVLVTGTTSALIALWSYSGNEISSVFYMLLLAVMSFMLFLPSLVEKLNIFPYIDSISILCVMVALVSLGSGLRLMKDNPRHESQNVEVQLTASNHTIKFVTQDSLAPVEYIKSPIKPINITKK